MQLQSHPLPNHTFNAPFFSPSAHVFTGTKLVSSPKFNSGFCNSLKKVSKSHTSLRNYSALISVRCELLLQGKGDDGYCMRRCATISSFKSGFFGSLKRMSESHTGLRNYGGGLVGFRCEALSQGMGDDGYYMRRCVELARKAIGCTSPNPMVGCVIVKDGKVVGEGFHPKAGANQPLQILIAGTPSPSIQIHVHTTEATSKVIIFTDQETAAEPETAQKGIETVVLERINLNTILEFCKRRGMCSVLLDLRGNCGGLEELLGESLEQNLPIKRL